MKTYVYAPIKDGKRTSSLARNVALCALDEQSGGIRYVGRNGRHGMAVVEGRRVLVLAPSPTLGDAVSDVQSLVNSVAELVIASHGNVGVVDFGVSGYIGVVDGEAREVSGTGTVAAIKRLVSKNPQVVLTHTACASAKGLPGAILYRYLARRLGATVRGFAQNQRIGYKNVGFEGAHVLEATPAGYLRYLNPTDPALWFIRWLP